MKSHYSILTLLKFKPSDEARQRAFNNGLLSSYKRIERERAALLRDLIDAAGLLAAVIFLLWLFTASAQAAEDGFIHAEIVPTFGGYVILAAGLYVLLGRRSRKP